MSFGRRHLHPESQLVVPDSRLQAAVSGPGPQMGLVPALDPVEQGALPVQVHAGRGLQVLKGLAFGIDERPLVDGRKESGAEIGGAGPENAVGHHDVGGEVVGFAPQAVQDPGAHARVPQLQASGVHVGESRTVDERLVVAGPDDGHVVRMLREPFEEVRDLDAGAAPLPEGPAAGHELGLVGIDLGQLQVGAEAGGEGLAVVAIQDRLGVEAVHLAQAALHEEEDDALGLGREMGFFGSERIIGAVDSREKPALPLQ